MKITSTVCKDGMTIEHREKGNRDYYRIEAAPDTIREVSSRFSLPIISSNGQNGAHINTNKGVIALLLFGGGLASVFCLGVTIISSVI
jgi:hypothetical protein